MEAIPTDNRSAEVAVCSDGATGSRTKRRVDTVTGLKRHPPMRKLRLQANTKTGI
jgi:hypothetical protein